MTDILLIDDSEIMLRHIENLLVQAGYEVVTASNMAGGLESYLKYKPLAVLTDFILEGGHTGLGLLGAIFSISQNGSGKIRTAILTTGTLKAEDASRAARQGTQLVQKPVLGEEEAFLRVVAAWLER